MPVKYFMEAKDELKSKDQSIALKPGELISASKYLDFLRNHQKKCAALTRCYRMLKISRSI